MTTLEELTEKLNTRRKELETWRDRLCKDNNLKHVVNQRLLELKKLQGYVKELEY